METERSYSPESEKSPDFDLAIIVHRHGPKEGLAGPLSKEGIEGTEEYFAEAYKRISLDRHDLDGIDVEHSPIGRTKQTAEIYSDVVRKYNNAKIRSTTEDERLSEGTVAEHPELIEQYGGKGGKWIKGWLDAKERPLKSVKTGNEAVKDFASWLLEKINIRKTSGGTQEIDAFSHGPLMLGFLLKLEAKLNQQILPEDWQDKKVFDNIMNYLSYINFYINSKRPDILTCHFKGNNYEVPITAIEELSGQE